MLIPFCRKNYILVRRQQYITHAVHMHYSYLLGLSKGCDFKVSRWSHTYYSFYNRSFTLTSACTTRMSLDLTFTCVCGCVQTAVHCLVRPSQLVIDPQAPTKLTFLTARWQRFCRSAWHDWELQLWKENVCSSVLPFHLPPKQSSAAC